MKNDITLIGICLVFILISPIILIGVACIIFLVLLLLTFDVIDFIKIKLNKQKKGIVNYGHKNRRAYKL